MPGCFVSDDLSDNVIELLKCAKGKPPTTAPLLISFYKTEASRRTIGISNPLSFLIVAEYVQKGWPKIKKITESRNSTSPVEYLHTYESIKEDTLNSENLRRAKGYKSLFSENQIKKTCLSMGYKYQLNVDISNFYDTIYTHSLTWAICGKKEAKDYFRSPGTAPKPKDYDWSDNLDRYVSLQKNGETNGLLTGPFTSRIVSEIILVAIDRILDEEGYIFCRYVDDFTFFFSTLTEAEESISSISALLKEYNLNLNTSKTEIKKFPFENYQNLNVELSIIPKKDVLGLLSRALKLQEEGIKGASKYAVKMIRNMHYRVEDAQQIVSILVNTMISNPPLGTIVVESLKNNILKIDRNQLSLVVNRELPICIERSLEQETLMLTFMARELELGLSCENICEIISKGGDLSTIIVLDIWKEISQSMNEEEKERVKGCIDLLIKNIPVDWCNSSKWLLIHEIEMNNFVEGFSATRTVFFEKLKEKNISFYKQKKSA